jgi:TonB family protein
MFTNLMASKPQRGSVSPSALGVSLVVHGLALLGLVAGASRIAPTPSTDDTYYAELTEWKAPPPPEVAPAPPPPPPVQHQAVVEVERPDLPQGFQEIAAPAQILAEIPPPGAIAFRAEDFSGEGVAGGVAHGRPLLLADTAKPAAFEPPPVSVAVVDKPPRILNASDMTNRMQALYPTKARLMGMAGDVVVQMVIDTKGQVEAEGLTIVSSTSPEFDEPTLAVVRLLRWEPARRNDRPIRVWVRLPVNWSFGTP